MGGHGQKFIAKDAKVHYFITAKADSLFHQKIKPVKLRWTQQWRRMNKKKKAQKPELRKQAQEAAAKEQKARMQQKSKTGGAAKAAPSKSKASGDQKQKGKQGDKLGKSA